MCQSIYLKSILLKKSISQDLNKHALRKAQTVWFALHISTGWRSEFYELLYSVLKGREISGKTDTFMCIFFMKLRYAFSYVNIKVNFLLRVSAEHRQL